MSNKFEDLVQDLHNTDPQPNTRYYEIVLSNADTILLEVSLRNQGVVARDLGMSLTRFSQLMPVIKESSSNNWLICKPEEL